MDGIHCLFEVGKLSGKRKKFNSSKCQKVLGIRGRVRVRRRFLFLRPIPDKSRSTIAQALSRIFCDICYRNKEALPGGHQLLRPLVPAKTFGPFNSFTVFPERVASNPSLKRGAAEIRFLWKVGTW
jgi:hypothetical protein